MEAIILLMCWKSISQFTMTLNTSMEKVILNSMTFHTRGSHAGALTR